MPGKPPGGQAQALSELKVVELGAFAAGPAVGKHLANHGAEVIHVESRTRPDGFRANYPPYKDNQAGPERAAMFAMTHDSKLGVTLNLKNRSGLDLGRRLLQRADVLIENFTPGTLARLGLGYDQLAVLNPGLVLLSTCNQGQTGPHSQQPGFGSHLTSLAGLTHLTGWPDREPALVWGPYIDYIAVAFGAVAVLAAVEQRRQSGHGCHIDLSQYETGLQFMVPALLDYAATGRVAQRSGNRDPGAAPHGIFPTRDAERWCAISVHDDDEWLRLRQALGDPHWAQDADLLFAAGRQAAAAELEAHLADFTRRLSTAELINTLRRAGVHGAPVNNMADLFSDPQLASRQTWRSVEHPVIGHYSAEGPPFLLSETPARIDSAAPLLGEHNRHVFCDLLGLSDGEYARLEAEGAFE